MGPTILGWVVAGVLFILIALRLYEFNTKLNEHTKQRHKHYRKREKATRDLMDDTPINEIKVGGTD